MTRPRSLAFVAAFTYLLAVPSLAQTTVRVSVDSLGAEADNVSRSPFLSSDGRYVVFWSWASNLVAGDTNDVYDVFVHDRQNGSTARASLSSNGTQADASSAYGAISDDGRYVAFVSLATNLVPGDTNGWSDVFVHDLQNGTTSIVSVSTLGVQGDGDSGNPCISADGRFIAFTGVSSTLVANDTNGVADVFVRDLVLGTTTRESVGAGVVQGNSSSHSPSLSADGRYVVFTSAASNLVPGDTNAVSDIFVRDRLTGTTTCASLDPIGMSANSSSTSAAISRDGRFVAFASYATSLVPGDTNVASDVFVRDLQTATTTRVSVSSSGAQGNGLGSDRPSISAYGRFVAFPSASSNLVAGDTNGASDAFVHDVLTGETTRVSVDDLGAEANSGSGPPCISGDGRSLAFDSLATNLVPADFNGKFDVFVRDRGALTAFTPVCFGDGSAVPCPCSNFGATGHGCNNSIASGGALLAASGVASLSADSVRLTSSNELAAAFTIVLQGNAMNAAVSFGDGLFCAGGTLLRLYSGHAAGGMFVVPQGAALSLSAASSALGQPIPLGATRHYKAYYRDPNGSFCPAPAGSTFNTSNAIAIAWGA